MKKTDWTDRMLAALVGYGLENAKRQKAYEEAKSRMAELVNRTAHLCAIAATHY